ncbi:unnamed protein product [Periconia digitata]|uniref:RNase III domain-containing protein n=1 Tax=Periconia digitata TaxID=1303443 RepID=A0A9W4XPP6_9PLEO|nr:unnamed protein product [Periconia digitata]
MLVAVPFVLLPYSSAFFTTSSNQFFSYPTLSPTHKMNIDQRIATVTNMFGHIFVRKNLCAEALQMAGPVACVIVNDAVSWVPKNNRLAIVGDAILDTVLCRKWYEGSDSAGPRPAHAWSSARLQIVGNEALNVRGNALGLGPMIIAGGGFAGAATPSMIATTFEAVFGAIYIDGGEAAVLDAVQHLDLQNHPSLMVTFTIPIPNYIESKAAFAQLTYNLLDP